MPFCPKCRYEYVPGIKVCPDCRVDLVDKLPPLAPKPSKPSKHRSDDLVTVAIYINPTLANIAKAKLQTEGISSFVADEYSWASNALGEVRLQVKESPADKARNVLSRH